jgi:hypothetical protein
LQVGRRRFNDYWVSCSLKKFFEPLFQIPDSRFASENGEGIFPVAIVNQLNEANLRLPFRSVLKQWKTPCFRCLLARHTQETAKVMIRIVGGENTVNAYFHTLHDPRHQSGSLPIGEIGPKSTDIILPIRVDRYLLQVHIWVQLIMDNHMDIRRTSAFLVSRTFFDCPAKYKYRYHLKMIPEGPHDQYTSVTGKQSTKLPKRIRSGRWFPHSNRRHCQGRIVRANSGRSRYARTAPWKGNIPKNSRSILGTLKSLPKKIGFDGHLEYQFKYDLDPPHGRMATGFHRPAHYSWRPVFHLGLQDDQKGLLAKEQTTRSKRICELRITYGRVVRREFGAKAEEHSCGLILPRRRLELVSVRFGDYMLEIR